MDRNQGTFCKSPILLAVLCSMVTLIILDATVAAADTHAAVPAAASAKPDPEIEKAHAAWRKAIVRVPMPKKGCFQASYPSMAWKEVRCVTPPQNPYQIGNGGQDVIASVGPQQISSATGSFDSVTGVLSETGSTFGSGCSNKVSGVANIFSLQITTNFFTNTMCPNSMQQCALEQFVYSNLGSVFVQYWLASKTPCPSGWKTSGPNCFMTGPGSPVAPLPTIADLANMSLTGNASSAGDTAVLTVNGNASATNQSLGNVLGLSGTGNWNTTEFGVFGDTCGSEALFTPTSNAGPNGAQIVLRTSFQDGSQKKPSCQVGGITGESNNLNFGPTAPAASGNPPALLVTQSGAGGASSFCAATTSVGDTHLATLDGLAYDFQASGDFLLLHADGDFSVQARQISGAPTWPNATTNSAVATRMGKTRVAICVNPTRFIVDGKSIEPTEGKRDSLPGDVTVLRNGSVYLIRDAGGDSVRATLNTNGANSWIDVAIGLGHTPQASVSGVLVNAPGNPTAIQTRTGTLMAEPVSFDDLYHTYADSWRVAPAESMLSVCGEAKIEPGLPQKPFFAKDLAPAVHERAQAVCKAAGIKVKSLLDDCTLDVAVIDSEKAAKAFVGVVAPLHVMRPPILKRPDSDHDK